MPAKMRLQRYGKKGMPFYHIVIADGRAPRDGRFIEKIGTYNPLARPADIQIDFDRALYWLQNGVQPSDTVRAILSYKGLLYKNHLLKGVQKGAMTEEQALVKFQDWLNEKEAKIQSKKNEFSQASRNERKIRLEHETKINQAKSEAIAKKFAKEAAKEAAAEEEAAAAEAVANMDLTEETPAAGEPNPEAATDNQ
jgi:small subunit ribosomal protein S16